MKKRKYIPFNLLKIELKISSQKNTKILRKWKEKTKLWNEAGEKMNWKGGRLDL
jgi:hypothetical protein